MKLVNWSYVKDENIINRINNMKLKHKVLILYGCIVVIPIILLGFIAEVVMFNFLRSDYTVSVIETVNQVVKNVEFRKSTYELLATRTATDGELKVKLSGTYLDFLSQWETVNYIDRSFGTVADYLPGVEDFRIYHKNDTLIEDGGILWKPSRRMIQGMNENEWYESMLSSRDNLKWDLFRDPHTGISKLTLSGKISYSSGGEAIGVVFLKIKSSLVFENILNNAFNQQGDVYLVKDNGIIFASSTEGLIGKNISETVLRDVPVKEYNIDTVMDINNKQEVIVSRRISSDWHVIATVPVDNIEQRTQSISLWIICITLCLVILSAILMLAVTNNVVQRLKRLGYKMGAVTKGKFNVTIKKDYSDELGDLESCFNLMAGRLGDLTEEIAVTRSREREEALKALQAQINPHFLYNTLGIIRWHALDLNDGELCNLVDAMTIFYRLALNRGNSVLHFREEIEHVKAYIQIQQVRYLNSVNVIWDIDPEAMDLFTIKLIMQPIVENCYIHGMVAKKGRGILKISVNLRNDCVIVKISDNGIGITEDGLEQILTSNFQSNKHSYGLLNIKERLKLYFNDRADLSIDSIWGDGTSVTIIVPACREPIVLREAKDNV